MLITSILHVDDLRLPLALHKLHAFVSCSSVSSAQHGTSAKIEIKDVHGIVCVYFITFPENKMFISYYNQIVNFILSVQ